MDSLKSIEDVFIFILYVMPARNGSWSWLKCLDLLRMKEESTFSQFKQWKGFAEWQEDALPVWTEIILNQSGSEKLAQIIYARKAAMLGKIRYFLNWWNNWLILWTELQETD